MSYLFDFEELNGKYVAFGGNPKGGKISRKGKIKTAKLYFDDVYFVKEFKFNLFSVSQMCDKKNSVLFTDTGCLVLSPDFKLPDESQVLLRVPRENNMYNSSGSTNPQNNDGDDAFDEKEHDFDAKKPESEVSVSPSSSAQSRKQDDKTKKEAKGKSPVESFTGYKDLSVEFEDCSDNSINEVNAAELEDITYSDDEDVVGVEADFNNLETSITVSHIPTTRVHKDHPVSQIIGDLSSTTQTKSMKRMVKDQGGLLHMFNDDFHTWFEDPYHSDKVYKVVKALYGLHQAPKAWSSERKSASTPIDTKMPLLKDPNGEDVDVHTYRSMNSSLIYLTSSRPDIMFAVCACARFQVTPKASHLHAVKRIFRYLKGKPQLGLWYPKYPPFDLVAYSDSDYVGASLDRKSTTGGCQFLGCRLISWQYKKQTVIATSSIKAEYIAAASYCVQVLWIQNQLLDYGDSPLLGVNTPRSDEDRLELMDLAVFLLPKVEKVGIRVNVVDLQVSAVRHMLLLLVHKLLLFSLTNWCCSLSAVSSLKYALTVNPNIYVSCIKQFWTTVAVKQVNDVTGLQALVDKKKVVVTEATIREALCLDDADDVDCLPNKEIFTELARMGYEKPSTKLTFYKAFFSSQWNLVRNVDSITKFYMYPRFLQLIIRKQVGDLLTHTTKYTSPALTQKGDEEGDAAEHVEEVNTSDVAEGDDSAAHEEVPTGEETREEEQGESVEAQKVGTSQRVETSDDTVMDDESNQGRMIAEMDHDDVVVLEDDKDEDRKVADVVKDVEEATVDESAQDQRRQAESQAEIYKIDMDHANKVLSMQEDETEPSEVQEVVDVVTTAKLIKEVVTAASKTVIAVRVVTRDPKEESTISTFIPAETKFKDKGKGILVEEPKPLKKKQQIKQNKQYARELHAELSKDINWDEAIDHVKRKAKDDPATKEQIEEDENKALQKINETPAERAAKRRKLDEEVEDLKRHLHIVPNEDDDVYTEATPLTRKVLIVDYEIIEMNNKPYYKIIRANGTHQLYISFLTLLRNFDREDLEALWSLVKERFSTAKPKNFSDDFLLTTLGAMFETPDAYAQI
nr:uncharacterized mitochondrial protein AtMg00810-like [Tanacetum cinerariifolium]